MTDRAVPSARRSRPERTESPSCYGILFGMTTASPRPDAPAATSRRHYAASKVPAVITVYFWIVKLLTTAMGEATSDYLAHKYNPYIVVMSGGVVLAIVLLIQVSARRYITWLY